MAIEIDISNEDILYAKTFITQYLKDKVPEGDFSDGSALQDLVVKSNAYSFALLRSELSKVKTLRSLKQLSDLDDDEETIEAVDDIISNLFINRGTGAKARVVVTLVLTQKVDIVIGTEVPFNRDGTHIFYPSQIYTINKEDLIERTSAQGVTSYETDITLIAADIGTSYEVNPGNFVSWNNFNPYVQSVRNDTKATGGDSTETNSDYINRSNDAITVRNLINSKSNKTVILDLFKDIGVKDVTTIGYGDPEMLRDIVNTNVTWTTVDVVHIGNHQDIYVRMLLLEDQTYSATTSTEIYLGEPERPGSIQLPQSPIYKISSVKHTDTGADLPYTLYVRDHRYFYTKEQEAYIVLVSGQNGIPVTITYDTVDGFDLIHNYLRNPDERITLANSLARACIPVYVEINFNYTQISGQPDLDVASAISTVAALINNLGNSESLSVDALIKIVHQNYGDSIILKTPLYLKGTVQYPDGSRLTFYSENILSAPEFDALGVTNRVCTYVTSNKYISFTKVN